MAASITSDLFTQGADPTGTLTILNNLFGGGSSTSTSNPDINQMFAQYFSDPSAFNVPSGLGRQVTTTTNSGGLFGGLLGGGGSSTSESWKPYIDANGNYVWKNPNTNVPVPVSSVPGASIAPNTQATQEANQVQSIVNLLPAYSKAVAGQEIPQAQASLAAQQATSPGLAQLMTQIYGTYGPQLNQIGSQIAQQNAVAQVGSDTASIQAASQPGGLLDSAKSAAEAYDPEYYNTRALASSKLSDLLNNINLNSGLSSTENREVGQSLAQQGTQRGTYNAPSNLDTVSNAMQYGQAGYNRLAQNRTALGNAIGNATAALPSFKSGTDVFQVATGKPSVPNAGAAQFTGVNSTGTSAANSTANSLTNSLMGLTSNTATNANQMAMNTANNATQVQLGTKDWADYLGQVTSSIGNIAGIAGGAVCWIARKVYGIDNPKWMLFRHYLLNEAPSSLRAIYLAKGEKIAENLTIDQANEIRGLMDNILA